MKISRIIYRSFAIHSRNSFGITEITQAVFDFSDNFLLLDFFSGPDLLFKVMTPFNRFNCIDKSLFKLFLLLLVSLQVVKFHLFFLFHSNICCFNLCKIAPMVGRDSLMTL